MSQRIILDCLQNHGLINQTYISTTVPFVVPANTNGIQTSQTIGPLHRIDQDHAKEFTIAELETMRDSKKTGTTYGYFAVLLLEYYSTK